MWKGRQKRRHDQKREEQEEERRVEIERGVGVRVFSEGKSLALIRRHPSSHRQAVYSEGGRQRKTENGKFPVPHIVLLKHLVP